MTTRPTIPSAILDGDARALRSTSPVSVPATGPVGTAGRMEVLRIFDWRLNEAGKRALVTLAQGLEQDPALRRGTDAG